MKWWVVRVVSGECRLGSLFASFVAATHTHKKRAREETEPLAVGISNGSIIKSPQNQEESATASAG